MSLSHQILLFLDEEKGKSLSVEVIREKLRKVVGADRNPLIPAHILLPSLLDEVEAELKDLLSLRLAGKTDVGYHITSLGRLMAISLRDRREKRHTPQTA